MTTPVNNCKIQQNTFARKGDYCEVFHRPWSRWRPFVDEQGDVIGILSRVNPNVHHQYLLVPATFLIELVEKQSKTY